MARIKAPFPWYGGKAVLAPLIVELIPTHDIYVEVFGGAASVLLAKKPVEVEVYNDLDGGLVNFFLQLRDHGPKLRGKLRKTPYARRECERAREVCLTSEHALVSPLEWARCWFVAAVQSYGAVLGKSSGWSYSKKKSHAKQWRRSIKRLDKITWRLRGVLVDNLDFAEIFTRYDSRKTIFYIDPPYISETRVEQNSRNSYRFEMREKHHRILVDTLLEIKGAGILSGYAHSIYDRLVTQGGWARVQIPTRTSMTSRLCSTDEKRVEVLWLSPAVERRRRRRGILTEE